jgi:hypothetical protein
MGPANWRAAAINNDGVLHGSELVLATEDTEITEKKG